MKFLYYYLTVIAILFFTALNNRSFAQTAGFINRQATIAAGRLVLDPNSDGYTSATTAGFTANNDVRTSEIAYKPIRAYSIEPYSDLRRGPNHRFSDFVPDSSGNGVYYYFSAAQQVQFRMRVGSIMPGSKGYSILMDTDGKFGATGPNADPGYVPSTTGTNGNPGFEIEIVLETNFRIAIYNVDNTSSPVLIKSYPLWQEKSQISIAGTNDNADPDFLIDFYIPFADLQAAPFNLNSSSSIRFCATTVMSPQASIGGPRSDIYGVNTDNYEDFIDGQPGCNIFNTVTTCPTAMCTAAPTVNSPLSTGTVNISGTWKKSALPGAASSTNIYIYKNTVLIDSVLNIATGATWTLNNIALVNGDIITAKAAAVNESRCLTSNAVVSSLCNSSNIPATPILSCYSGSKGVTGTNLSTGWTIHVDNLTRNINNDNVINTGGLFGANTGTSPNITWTYSGGCASGAPLQSGSYKIYYTNNLSGCSSAPAYFCAGGNGPNTLATPASPLVITSPANSIYTTATKTITGTTDATANLFLYVEGAIVQTVTADAGGNFNFTNLTLLNGQKLFIVNEFNRPSVGASQCASQTALFTVSCYTQTPVINADNNNQITSGSPITGTSTEPIGTTIRVYNSLNALLATTTVQTGGLWSTGDPGTLPSPYNAIAGTSYYANAQNGTCGISVNSATVTAAVPTSNARCGTITGPLTAGTTNINGTVTGSFTTTTVNLYMDGEFIGTTTTTGTSWGPIAVNDILRPETILYPDAVITIGIKETNKQEVFCPGSAITVLCTPTPAAPIFTPTNTTITTGSQVTYTITNAMAGTFYAIADSATGASLAQGIWATANGSLNITTNPFTSPGTYKVVVKSSSLSGVTICTATSLTGTVSSNGVLSVNLLNFSGTKAGTGIILNWSVSNEYQLSRYEIERSGNGFSFEKLSQQAAGIASNIQKTYSFTDKEPLAKNNYYRLKLIDTDGKFSYSKLVVFSNSSIVSMIVNNPTPNPFKESFKLNVDLAKATVINLSLVDVTGRVVFTNIVAGKQGTNLIEFNKLSTLEAGVYFLVIKTADASVQQKVLKIN